MKRAKSAVHRKVLPNGLVLIAEPMPHARSVSIGIWVRAGSRGEPAAPERHRPFHRAHGLQGHLAAHRRADRPRNGLGRRPCSTPSPPRRSVCFNAKVLDEHLPLAFDVLSDLVLRPLFAEEDIVKERQVILEEIRMEEDNPESVAHELLTKNFWRGHPLGARHPGHARERATLHRAAVLRLFPPLVRAQ